MTKIHITSKWSDVKPQGFYVYIHRRVTDGGVFYVGKGCERRAWNKNRTHNPYWMNVARKHGVGVSICQDGMSEDDAYLLEAWVINKIRHRGGVLANLSDGDAGISGSGGKVYCSNGIEFGSVRDASQWVLNNDLGCNPYSSIAACCSGRRHTAYGLAWSKSDKAPEVINVWGKNKSRPVICSNGMRFDFINDAVRWLNSIGLHTATHSNISSCAAGRLNTAYGYTWKYA